MKRGIYLAAAALLLFACDDESTEPEGGGGAGGQVEADGATRILDASALDAAPDQAVDAFVPDPDLALPDAAPDGPEPDLGVVVFDLGLPDVPDAEPRDEACIMLPEPIEQPPIDLDPRCSAPDGPLRIRDLRDARCPAYQALPTNNPGVDIELSEAIVTGIYGSDFTVQDPEGGAWSGAFVYGNFQPLPEGLQVGSRVAINARVIEFFSLTEIVRDSPDDVVVIAQGDAPEPIRIADTADVADDGVFAEPLESVLIRIENVRVTSTAPDCPRDFGMFVVSGGLRVDDNAPFDYEPSKNDVIRSIVGPTSYTFGHFKILPRGDADIDWVYCGGIPDKCEATPCPVEPDAEETGGLIISEIQNNPRGDDNLREFVELYNPSPNPMELAGWRVQDCAGNEAPLAGTVGPRGYFVLARSLDEDENGGVEADVGFGDLFLPNAFGSVLVFDADNQLVDQVRYEPGGDVWPERFPGQTLELIEAAADNRVGNAWAAGEEEYGPGGRGTPGAPYED